MFKKEEIKEFIVKIGSKWFFPDFSNKVTWYVVTLGAAVILTPGPLKVLISNWLIDVFNLNYGEYVKLKDVSNTNADHWLGFGLIFISLLHNVFSKWLIFQDTLMTQIDADRGRETDIKLFNEFMSKLPSGSWTVELLKNHDFGNVFKIEEIAEIDRFVEFWNSPDKSFLNESIEVKKYALWEKGREFSRLISQSTSPTRQGHQSVVPDEYRNRDDWPKRYDDEIKMLNDTATEVFNLHQDFIKFGRKTLKC